MCLELCIVPCARVTALHSIVLQLAGPHDPTLRTLVPDSSRNTHILAQEVVEVSHRRVTSFQQNIHITRKEVTRADDGGGIARERMWGDGGCRTHVSCIACHLPYRTSSVFAAG